MRRLTVLALALALHLVHPSPAEADPLLTPSREVMLEGWLGQGDLDFTNLYTRVADDTTLDFHAAVDDQGPTFTLVEVVYQGETHVIGGYNPRSWRSPTQPAGPDDAWNLSPTDAERTAFIYNLTTGVQQLQRLQSDPDNVGSPYLLGDYGIFQTWNAPVGGPMFGGPGGTHDIAIFFGPVDQFPTGGHGQIHQMTYGQSWPECLSRAKGENILGEVTCMTSGNGSLSGVGAIEVYAFVPEPALPPSLALGAGVLMAWGARRSRSSR